MNDDRAGRVIRAVRIELGLRQLDVARRAGVDQKTVSLIERGELIRVSIRSLRDICRALEITQGIELRWQGGMIDRLIDRGHAALVELALTELRALGWETIPELTFNEFGERGSVDIVAWHPRTRVLLIVEVKTVLTDLQAMLMSLSKKVRIVPGLLATERGWDRRGLGRILVVDGSRGNRATVARHASMFDATFPGRTVEARRWLHYATGDFAGLWFVAPRHVNPRNATPSQRVRLTCARSPARKTSSQASRS